MLLIERFDRAPTAKGWRRKIMVSALTMLELDKMMARYASYQDLAENIRHRFCDPAATLRELFARIVFNILCGATDYHARNHAAFWDGETLNLTPACDICPQGRSGQEATQTMLINEQNRLSRIASCVEAAPHVLIDHGEALAIVKEQLRRIGENWNDIYSEAKLTEADRNFFRGRQCLNPHAFTALESDAARLVALADDIRRAV